MAHRIQMNWKQVSLLRDGKLSQPQKAGEAVLGRYTPSHVPGVNMTLMGGDNFILQLKVFL